MDSSPLGGRQARVSMKRIAFWTCLTASVVTFGAGAANYTAYLMAERQQQSATMARIGRQFDLSAAGAARLTTSLADMLARLPGVTHGLAAGDRQEILARIAPGFPELRAKFGVDVMVATDAQNRAVVRAHEPASFGDDQSRSRPMIVQANAQKLPMSGFEIGSYGLRMRAVVPVFHEQKHVGVFEVGQKLDAILDSIKRISSSDFWILLDKDVAARAIRSDQKARTVVDQMIVEASTNDRLIKALDSLTDFSMVKEATMREVKTADDDYTLYLMPLADFSGQPLGTVVVARNMEDLRAIRKTALVETLAFSAMGAVMLIALILLVVNGLLVRPIELAAKSAEDMAEGKMPQPLPESGGVGPVKRLFAALEKLRAHGEAPH